MPGEFNPVAGGTAQITARFRDDALAIPVPWVMSARTERELHDRARQLRAYASADPAPDMAAIAAELAAARQVFQHRAVVLAGDRQRGLDALVALVGGQPSADLITGVAATTGKVAFVFPGQGSQWAGMAAELSRTSAVFRDELNACAEALAPHIRCPLLDVLADAEHAPGADRPEVVQPALFAVMVSLAAVWRAAGVEPDAVLGHSQGEIAAAYVGGALTLPDAARVVARRSQALATLAGTGSMASVPLAAGDVGALLSQQPDWAANAGIAALNGPTTTIITGRTDTLKTIVAYCNDHDIPARRIPVDYASHSPAVESLRGRLLSSLSAVAPRSSAVAYYSTLTGSVIDTRHLDAGYWYRSLRNAVRFEPATRMLYDHGHRTFIEASPRPVLTLPIQDTLAAHADPRTSTTPSGGGRTGDTLTVGSLRRNDGGWHRFLSALAQVHIHGTPVDWATLIAANKPSGLQQMSRHLS
jgi:acyl transferase domain-containing protein